MPLAVVTGGAGFIGSHMVDLLLAEGFAVHVIDNLSGGGGGKLQPPRGATRAKTRGPRGGETRLRVDTRDIRELDPGDAVFKDAAYVFHFAGIGDIVPSIERPIDYMSANVMGTVHALEAARRAGAKRFVYAASSSCYGLAEELPTTESAPIRPQYPYALSKLLGEQATLHWGQVYKLPVNSIRIF